MLGELLQLLLGTQPLLSIEQQYFAFFSTMNGIQNQMKNSSEKCFVYHQEIHQEIQPNHYLRNHEYILTHSFLP
jgi:hypothetical protein